MISNPKEYSLDMGTLVDLVIQFLLCRLAIGYVVGPCHHGMARPQVADRGTASDKEGSCE